ncbi:hypothetical protein AB0H00_27460 [Nocardia sp. NPDC023852]|uniref:hypothetical protein n=1 Tax=Nocardia sp. NPDC023852 TaxID=3154697 RepID=UPI0033E9466B
MADGPAEFSAVQTAGIVRCEHFRQLGRIAGRRTGSIDDEHNGRGVHFDGGSQWR